MNISTPIIGVLILFIARLQLSALRGQVDWLSHLHFHAALSSSQASDHSLPSSVRKAHSLRCSSSPMKTHFVGLFIGIKSIPKKTIRGSRIRIVTGRWGRRRVRWGRHNPLMRGRRIPLLRAAGGSRRSSGRWRRLRGLSPHRACPCGPGRSCRRRRSATSGRVRRPASRPSQSGPWVSAS